MSSIIIYWLGSSPYEVFSRIFEVAFGSPKSFASTVAKAIPLILVSGGLLLAFKVRAWNIGAPGQMVVGAIGGSAIALFLPFSLPSPLHLTLMFIVGGLAGAAWAGIAAYLNLKMDVNMVLGTLMLNYIAFYLLRYLLYGPWQRPGPGFPFTPRFPSSATLPTLEGTSLHYPTLILGIIVIVVIFIVLRRTKWGYEIEVTGGNPDAAEYAGINTSKLIFIIMLISGALAGLAGVGEVAGIHGLLRMGVAGGGIVYASSYGYTAIIVANLGRLNAWGSFAASLFIGGILVGGDAFQLMGLPYALVSVTLGLMLLALTAGVYLRKYRIQIGGQGSA